jgi:hypothetical protein
VAVGPQIDTSRTLLPVLDPFMFPFWPVLTALFLISVAGLNLACSKKPLPGNTSFIQAKKGFEKELTPDQRKAAIKQLQTETAGKP